MEVAQIDDTLFATPGFTSYQWFESGMPIAGATQQKHTITFDGIYSVEAIYSNGCIETSDTFDSDFLLPPPEEEPEPQSLSEQMGISPNPVIGVFKVTAILPPDDKTATINITDATGRSLYEKTIEVVDGKVNEEIDMGKDISSFCILKLESKSSNKAIRFYKRQ